MDKIYATLIIHELRTFESVPDVIKSRVKLRLEELGFPELAEVEL